MICNVKTCPEANFTHCGWGDECKDIHCRSNIIFHIFADSPRGGSLEQVSWTFWAQQIGTPIIMLIGVTGNVLSFLVLKSKRYRFKSYSHYLCTLAVFDSLVLIFKYISRLNKLLQTTGHAGLFDEYGDAACKVENILGFLWNLNKLMSLYRWKDNEWKK